MVGSDAPLHLSRSRSRFCGWCGLAPGHGVLLVVMAMTIVLVSTWSARGPFYPFAWILHRGAGARASSTNNATATTTANQAQGTDQVKLSCCVPFSSTIQHCATQVESFTLVSARAYWLTAEPESECESDSESEPESSPPNRTNKNTTNAEAEACRNSCSPCSLSQNLPFLASRPVLCTPLPDRGRYITFPANWGFNNRRQSFYIGVLAAFLLNRTLVLPSPDGQPFDGDVFDLDALSTVIPITTRQSLAARGIRLNELTWLNLEWHDGQTTIYYTKPILNDTKAWNQIRNWTSWQSHVSRDTNQRTWFVSELRQAHQPPLLETAATWGYVEHISNLPKFVMNSWYRLERGYLHYHPRMFWLADRVLRLIATRVTSNLGIHDAMAEPIVGVAGRSSMPAPCFSDANPPCTPKFIAIHWRQGDFFPNLILTPQFLWSRLMELRKLDPSVTTIYLSTDDIQSNLTSTFLRVVEEYNADIEKRTVAASTSASSVNSSSSSPRVFVPGQYRVLWWKSLVSHNIFAAGELGSTRTSPANPGTTDAVRISVIEQIVCAHSVYFIPTPVSSWSDGVLRMRRFLLQDDLMTSRLTNKPGSWLHSTFANEWSNFTRKYPEPPPPAYQL